MRKFIWSLFLVGVSLMGLAVAAQPEGGAVNIAFVFDASGSMGAAMDGRTRLAVAQDAMAELAAGLPPGTNASLWVYGHRLPQDDPAASCLDIEEVIALQPIDAPVFEDAVRGLNSIGYTPITDSIQLAAQTLLDQPDARNTMVLVSDGEETCGGQPCLMAQALKQANIALTINTIGFAPDEVTREQLECIAEVTGGTYYEADDAQQLTEALQSAVAVPGTVQIVDATGAPITDIAFTVLARPDGEARPFTGSASLPAGEYDVVIESDPPTNVRVTVVDGETVNIVLDIVQVGTLRLVDADGVALIDQAFVATRVNTGEQVFAAGTVDVPPGTYSVEVSTDPPFTAEAYVYANEVTDVVVSAPTGTVRTVDEEGVPLENMVFDLTPVGGGEVVVVTGISDVPPGRYTATVYTDISFTVDVEVAIGVVTDIVVPATGTVRVVDEAGAVLAGLVFTLTNADTGDLVAAYGAINVPPGSYSAEVNTDIPFTVELEVVAGEVVDIVVGATGTVRTVDEQGVPLEEVVFAITNTDTGDATTVIGTLDLPPGSYTAQVFTDVPFSVELAVVAGEVTDIVVGAVGTIRVVDENGDVVADLLFTAIPEAGGDSANALGSLEVPPGAYSVEVFTTFPFTIDVEVVAGEMTDILIADTGMIEVVDALGRVQDSVLLTAERLDDGESTSALGEVDVPPGSYTVEVFTTFPFTLEVEVIAGESTEVLVEDTGTIEAVDARGRVQDSVLLTVERLEDGASTNALGEVDVPPGLYHVTILGDKTLEVDVEVLAGETTTVNVANGVTNRPAP